MNDKELETRLARWRPADAPPELLRNLRAAAPPARTRRWSWLLAYAALSAAWVVIFTLWLLTPREELVPASGIAQTDAAPTSTPAFPGTLAMERSFLSQSNPDQL